MNPPNDTDFLRLHVFTAAGGMSGFTPDPQGANLPAEFAPWKRKGPVVLGRGVAAAGIDVDACLDDVAARGFHLVRADAPEPPLLSGAFCTPGKPCG